MSHKVYLRPEAETDVEDAAVWYEKQREGLGQNFLDDVLSTFETISENPNLHPAIHRHTRRAVVHRFPFGIYYRVEESSVVVVALCTVAAIHNGGKKEYNWGMRAGGSPISRLVVKAKLPRSQNYQF